MAAKGSKMGFQVVMDFFTQMAIEGRVFQVRAGDIATPLIGDVPIADTKAEFCADAASGTTIIPCYASIGITLLAGTANQIKIQSVGVVSSAGTAFVPLPMLAGGRAAASTARAATAGGVTVTADTPKVVTFRAIVSKAYDLDGLQAALKPVRDALVRVGVVADDSPDRLRVGPVEYERGEETGIMLVVRVQA